MFLRPDPGPTRPVPGPTGLGKGGVEVHKGLWPERAEHGGSYAAWRSCQHTWDDVQSAKKAPQHKNVPHCLLQDWQATISGPPFHLKLFSTKMQNIAPPNHFVEGSH